MAKVMKKLSALLLVFAMMFTMMPALSLTAFAEDGEAIRVYVNGIDTGNGVTAQWMEENSLEAQVFPFPAKQGQNWAYFIAQGPSYEKVLKETLEFESLEDLSAASIVWRNALGEEQNNKKGWNTLNVADLALAVDQFKLVNADTGEDITGAFAVDGLNVKVAPIDNAPALTPIIATKESKGYADYATASEALKGAWESGTNIRPYLGGNLKKDQFLRIDSEEEPIQGGSVNFTGRFSMADQPQINVKIAAPDAVEMTFEGPDADAQKAELSYPVSDEVKAALAENAVWETSDEAVATVEKGVVTPAGTGSCTVTAKGDDQTVAAVFNVTVNKPVKTLFSVYVNGAETGKSITNQWMEENSLEAQIFPFPAKQGQNWAYFIAQGPSYEAVLKETLGIESLEDIKNAQIVWRNEAGEEQNNKKGWNTLNVADLALAVDQFKLVNADTGEDITGAFAVDGLNVKVAPIDNAPAIIPIIATKQSKGYADYAAAAKALEEGAWASGTSIRPYLGGNLKKDQFLRINSEEEPIQGGSVNFTGRFSMADQPQLNVKIAADTNATSLNFANTVAKPVPVKYTEKEMELLGGVTWKSGNANVATVSGGKVTPKGIGSCVVTAQLADGTVLEKCSVTVQAAAFTPGVPGSFKAVNVKKKSAKLTWKKVTGATGYEVYRSTKKKSGYKKVATIKKASTVKYTKKKLKKGKTYYFKIRAYRTVNGKNVYSKFTSAKKVKIKK